MLTGSIVDHVLFVPGGSEGLAEDLRASRSRGVELGEPVRPAWIEAGRWRRMSRLTRFAALAVGELLERHPELDRDTLPLVQGSAMGEVVPSAAFLDRLFGEGPATASPLAFQNSVYNATGGHISMAFGLRGPSETLSAGMATGLACLARAFELLARHPAVLVVVGDDLNPTTVKAYLQSPVPAGEAVVALLVTPGADVQIVDGVAPGPGSCFARGGALPYERDFTPVSALRPEASVGLSCVAGLVALLAVPEAVVVDQDGAMALTARR